MSIADIDKHIQFEQARRTGYFMKKLADYKTRYNIWDRPDKSKDPNAFPWTGASDQKVYKVESEIRKAKAMRVSAFFKSRMFFEPMDRTALENAKLAEEFWHWMVHMRVQPRREVILAADILGELGLVVIHTVWDMEKSILFEAFNPKLLPPDVLQAIQENKIQLAEQLLPIVRAIYPDNTDQELIKAWDDFNNGVPLDDIKLKRVCYTKAQPYFAACSPTRDIIVPSYTTELNNADWIVRIYRYSQQALIRDQFNLDYDPKIVKWLCDNCYDQYGNAKTREISTTQDSAVKSLRDARYGISSDAREGLLVYDLYERVYDPKDGKASMRVVTYCPAYQDKPLRKVKNLGYPHGQYPFVEIEEEVVDRNIHASRGKPNILKPIQDELKIQKDSRIDRTNYNLLPTVVHPMGMPPGELGPASTYGYAVKPDELGYLQLPPQDGTSDRVSAELRADSDEFYGSVSPGSPSPTGSIQPQSAKADQMQGAVNNVLQEFELENWMMGWQRAMQQGWALTQAYLPEEIWFKAVGVPNAPSLRVSVDLIQGKYVIVPVVSIQDIMPEKAQESAKMILDVAMQDHSGAVDLYEALQVFFTRLDVKAARRVLRPPQQAQQNEIDAEQTALTRISAGVPMDVPPNCNFQLRIKIAEQYIQQPDIQQRINSDKGFAVRMKVHMEQLQQVAAQAKNAQTGRQGALFPHPFNMQPPQPSDMIQPGNPATLQNAQ